MRWRLSSIQTIMISLLLATAAARPLMAGTETYVRFGEASDHNIAAEPQAVAAPQSAISVNPNEPLPAIPLQFTGTDYTSIILDQRTNIDDVVALVRDVAAAARRQNPELGSISFTVSLNTAASKATAEERDLLEVARVVQRDVRNTDVMVFEPTEDFDKGVTQPKHRQFLRIAEQRTARLNAKLSVIRMVANGVVTSINIFINHHSFVSATVGGITAGMFAYGFHKKNTQLLYFLESHAFWDRTGDLKKSKLLGWKVAYGAWKVLKHSAIIATYLTGVHLASTIAFAAVQGDVLSANPYPQGLVGFLASTYVPSVLSSLSFGRWKQNESQLVCEAIDCNEVENYANHEAGYNSAERTLVVSQIAAVLLSAVSVASESMSLNPYTWWLSSYVMIGVGVSGWGYYAWRFGGIRDLPVFKQLRNYVSSKIKAVYGDCSSGFSDPLGN